MHTIPNGVINGTVAGANHPHYSVIRAPTVSFITPFGMVCTQCRLNKQACMSMQAKWS